MSKSKKDTDKSCKNCSFCPFAIGDVVFLGEKGGWHTIGEVIDIRPGYFNIATAFDENGKPFKETIKENFYTTNDIQVLR